MWVRALAEGWNKKGTGPGLRLSGPVPPFGLRSTGILNSKYLFIRLSRLSRSMWDLAASFRLFTVVHGLSSHGWQA